MQKRFSWQFISTFVKASPYLAVTYALIGCAIVYGAYSYIIPTQVTTSYTLAQVTKGTLTTYVSSSGQVVVTNQLDLKPQSSGTITSIRVTVGQKVQKGQTLLTLDSRAAAVSLKQAQANLASAQASYDKTVAGATASDILSSQSALENSKVSLVNARQNALTKLLDTYTQVNDIITTKTNIFFINPNTQAPTLAIPNYPLNNQILQSTIEKSRASINALLPTWQTSISTIDVNDPNINQRISDSIDTLNKVAAYLDNLSTAFNSSNGVSISSTVSTYQSTVSSSRSTVSSLISALIATQQGIAQAEAQVNQNQATLDLKKAPTSSNDLIIAKAQLSNSEANLQSAETNYANTILSAPFDAVVGAVNAKIGDQASSGTAAITLITSNQVVQLSLNEVDATKIKLGQKATLTFDAIPDLTIAGTVVEVSPLGTVTQGVVTYPVKVSLDSLDDRVKPGMSSTVNIITAIKTDTLIVPNEAVTTSGDNNTILVPESSFTSASTTVTTELTPAPTKKEVTVGITNDTSTEIISGIKEGDWIVTKTTTAGATKAAPKTSGISLLGGAGGSGGNRGTTVGR